MGPGTITRPVVYMHVCGFDRSYCFYPQKSNHGPDLRKTEPRATVTLREVSIHAVRNL